MEIRYCYYYNDFDDPNREWIFGESALQLGLEQNKELQKKMKEAGWI
ncbi:MAG: hypothetical protein ACFFCV_02545 [Promethearchaeota archaeon]